MSLVDTFLHCEYVNVLKEKAYDRKDFSFYESDLMKAAVTLAKAEITDFKNEVYYEYDNPKFRRLSEDDLLDMQKDNVLDVLKTLKGDFIPLNLTLHQEEYFSYFICGLVGDNISFKKTIYDADKLFQFFCEEAYARAAEEV